MPKTLGLRKNF